MNAGGYGSTLVAPDSVFDRRDASTMMKEDGCPLLQVRSAFPYRGLTIARRMQGMDPAHAGSARRSRKFHASRPQATPIRWTGPSCSR